MNVSIVGILLIHYIFITLQHFQIVNTMSEVPYTCRLEQTKARKEYNVSRRTGYHIYKV